MKMATSETPYASHTLSKPEQNYPQLEQEGHALVFGVKKFHSCLYGRQFTMYTDHNPLQTLTLRYPYQC